MILNSKIRYKRSGRTKRYDISLDVFSLDVAELHKDKLSRGMRSTKAMKDFLHRGLKTV